MTELVWDDGMSVGIDAIDDDHKKLINILALLMSAKHEALPNQDIEKIFYQLERYTLLHFSREEALLEKVNYENIVKHKLSHQQFIDKIPQLKQQWLETQNKQVLDTYLSDDADKVQESIINFLQKWLVNHILEEDLDYVPALRCNNQLTEYQKLKESKHPLLRFFSKKLSSYFGLKHRVFITTLLPVAAVLILSLIYLNTNYQRYQNMKMAVDLNTVVDQVNSIVHSLQSERGLSSGYVSSNYKNFAKQLEERRVITDEKVSFFLSSFLRKPKTNTNDNITQYAAKVKNVIAGLTLYRRKLDQQKDNFDLTYLSYTRLIGELVAISERLTFLDIDVSYIKDMSTINSSLLFKELMGQVRAIGMNMLESRDANIYENIEMTKLIGRQEYTLRALLYSANEKQKEYCADLCNAIIQTALIESYYHNALSSKDSTLNSTQWFNIMSAHIDDINLVSTVFITAFNEKISNENIRLENKYYVVLFSLSLFVLAALFFSLVLNYSIISPIRKLTYALNDMSLGQNNLHFNNVHGNDEISAMQRAYEKLRRKLMQGDVYKATVSEQQKEIKYRKSQQDHFQHLALTDALTGAVNRLHFNDVLGKEIINVNEHGRPLSIMILDIDYFKLVNDRYGHGVGDDVLIMFYRTCKKVVRASDVVARIGGEEFVIVMPDTTLKSAEVFAERLRKRIERLDIKVDEHDISLTVSIGVSQWRAEQFISAETFIAHADKSLYVAKNAGRNKVVAA